MFKPLSVCARVLGCVRVCACVCICVGVRVHMHVYKCRNPASDQSTTGMKKTNDAGTDRVPDQADAVRDFFGPVRD